MVNSIKSRVAFVLISKLYRQMYANTGIATDSARVARSTRWANLLGRGVPAFFLAAPMPQLQIPNFPDLFQLPRSQLILLTMKRSAVRVAEVTRGAFMIVWVVRAQSRPGW